MTKPNHRRRSEHTLPGDAGPSAGHRHARLESALQTELTLLLRDEITNPALMDVTLRSVTLSADYHHARIQFTLPDGATPGAAREAQLALERAAGFLRSGLADALDLKRTPSLKFLYAPGTPGADDEDAWWK